MAYKEKFGSIGNGQCRLCGSSDRKLSKTHILANSLFDGEFTELVMVSDRPGEPVSFDFGRPKEGGAHAKLFCIECNQNVGLHDGRAARLWMEMYVVTQRVYGDNPPTATMIPIGLLNDEEFVSLVKSFFAVAFMVDGKLCNKFPEIAKWISDRVVPSSVQELPIAELNKFPRVFIGYNTNNEVKVRFMGNMLTFNLAIEDGRSRVGTPKRSPLAVLSFPPLHVIYAYDDEIPEDIAVLPELKTLLTNRLQETSLTCSGIIAPRVEIRDTTLKFDLPWENIDVFKVDGKVEPCYLQMTVEELSRIASDGLKEEMVE